MTRIDVTRGWVGHVVGLKAALGWTERAGQVNALQNMMMVLEPGTCIFQHGKLGPELNGVLSTVIFAMNEQLALGEIDWSFSTQSLALNHRRRPRSTE